MAAGSISTSNIEKIEPQRHEGTKASLSLLWVFVVYSMDFQANMLPGPAQHNVAKIRFIFALYQPGYRPDIIVGKESPDSKEQHTG